MTKKWHISWYSLGLLSLLFLLSFGSWATQTEAAVLYSHRYDVGTNARTITTAAYGGGSYWLTAFDTAPAYLLTSPTTTLYVTVAEPNSSDGFEAGNVDLLDCSPATTEGIYISGGVTLCHNGTYNDYPSSGYTTSTNPDGGLFVTYAVPNASIGSGDKFAAYFHFVYGTQSLYADTANNGNYNTINQYMDSYGVWACVDDNGTDCTSPPTPPTASTSISFFFPTNGTTTGVFSNWIVSTTLGNDIIPNTISVKYGATTSSLNTLVVPQDGIIEQTNNVIQFIPSSLNSAGTYYAQASIISPGPGYYVLATSSVISFTVSSTMPFVSNNTAHFIAPLATSTAFCIAPGNTLNIGEGIAFGVCSVAGTLFGDNAPSYGFMQTQWLAFQQVAPFNLIFGIASSVQNSVNASATQQNLSINLPIGYINSDVSILSSSTLTQLFKSAGNGHNIPACDQTCAQAKTDTLMGYISNVIYAGTGITTMAMIL